MYRLGHCVLFLVLKRYCGAIRKKGADYVRFLNMTGGCEIVQVPVKVSVPIAIHSLSISGVLVKLGNQHLLMLLELLMDTARYSVSSS